MDGNGLSIALAVYRDYRHFDPRRKIVTISASLDQEVVNCWADLPTPLCDVFVEASVQFSLQWFDLWV